jgi:hypothetical protein
LLEGDFELMRQELTSAQYERWREARFHSKPGLFSSFGNANRNMDQQSSEYLRTRAELDIEDFQHATFARDIKISLESLQVFGSYATPDGQTQELL